MTQTYPTWSWTFEGPDGAPVQPAIAAGLTFPNQADAESWVGLSWRDLLAEGVEQVSLYEGDRLVYAAMSLRPVR